MSGKPLSAPALRILSRRSRVPLPELANWLEVGVIRAYLDEGGEPTDECVLLAAILAEFRALRLTTTELGMISRSVLEGMDGVVSLGIEHDDIPRVARHAALRLADAEGDFAALAKADRVDPAIRLFNAYPDYLEWCDQSGTGLTVDERDVVDRIDEWTLATLGYCYDLGRPDLLRTNEPAILWDVIFVADTPLLYTRRAGDPPPYDPAEQDDATRCLTVSLSAIARKVAARAGRHS